MIYQQKPLQISLNKHVHQLTSVLEEKEVKSSTKPQKKEIIFFRYIGMATRDERDYIQLVKILDSKFEQCGAYVRLSQLTQHIPIAEIHRLSSIWEEYEKAHKRSLEVLSKCKFPVKYENPTLEWTQKKVFHDMMSDFQRRYPNVTSSMLKNFGIKILYWSSLYLDKLLPTKTAPNNRSYLVYIGKIKYQELLFLYYINQLGCHVIYMNPYKDINEEFREVDIFSTLQKEPYFAKKHIEIEDYKKIEKVTPANAKELTYEQLANLSEAVVMIIVYNQNKERIATGSGVVIHSEGYVLTNDHVIRGGHFYTIQFENASQEETMTQVIKYHSDFDLAVLKVPKAPKSLPIRKKEVVRGEKVVAIGSPLGLFNSISDGIVSAKRMTKRQSMIQFTAPISGGSSGGALLDLRGHLVGLITASFDEGQNLNLAVDSETIRMFAHPFIEMIY